MQKKYKSRVFQHCCNIQTKNISFLYFLFCYGFFVKCCRLAHNEKTDFICHGGKKYGKMMSHFMEDIVVEKIE